MRDLTRRSTLGIAATILGLSACLVAASAAGLGGLSSDSITAHTSTGSPFVVSMSESFNGSGAIDGRSLATGQGWLVHSGTWSRSGSRARTTSTLTDQLVTLPWLTTSTSLSLDLTTSGTFRAGAAMHVSDTGAAATVMRVSSSGGTVQLGRLSGGTFTVWGSAAAAGTATWVMTYSAGTYTVSRNGSTLLSYRVPAANVTGIEAGTRVGLYSSGTNSNTRWDNLTVSSP